jgi:hypothetical protein
MPKTLPKAPKNKKPPLKFQPPVKPREVQRQKIAVMEQYLQQLKERGAPASELATEAQKIADAYKQLMLMTD